jgi:hypothetical protein
VKDLTNVIIPHFLLGGISFDLSETSRFWVIQIGCRYYESKTTS